MEIFGLTAGDVNFLTEKPRMGGNYPQLMTRANFLITIDRRALMHMLPALGQNFTSGNPEFRHKLFIETQESRHGLGH